MSDIESYAEHDADEVAAYTLEADDLIPHERGACLHFDVIGKNAYTCSINGELPEIIVTYVTDAEVRIQLAAGGPVTVVRSKFTKRVASSFDVAIAILAVSGKKVKPEE